MPRTAPESILTIGTFVVRSLAVPTVAAPDAAKVSAARGADIAASSARREQITFMSGHLFTSRMAAGNRDAPP
jgi:hypothetical protein